MAADGVIAENIQLISTDLTFVVQGRAGGRFTVEGKAQAILEGHAKDIGRPHCNRAGRMGGAVEDSA